MAYDIPSMQMPRIAGKALRALVKAVETPGLGHAVRVQMLSNLGFDVFRNTPAHGSIAFGPALPSLDRQASAPVSPSLLESMLQSAVHESGFRFETVADYRRAYLDGATTPTQVAERLADAIAQSDQSDPPLRVFITFRREDLVRQAEQSTRRYAEGRPLSVLDGVPVAVKDEVDMLGYPTTVGTRRLGKEAACQEATAVARLRAAGALLIGKANMHELGIGVTGINPHHGAARNPYDRSCITGGSSSGSAAAVAAGMGPLALGADGGGSIRIPASLCGLVGLKPTFGRISEKGAAPLCWSVAHLGPIGATAMDATIGYALMAGKDEADIFSLRQPEVEVEGIQEQNLEGYKLGVFRPWFEDADPQVLSACERTLKGLTERGASVVEIDIEGLNLARLAHLVTIVAEMAASQQAQGVQKSQYGLDTRLNFALGQALTASDYVHAQRHRAAICDYFSRIFEHLDGIVTPTTACTAPIIHEDALSGESNLTLLGKLMRFVAVANLTGLPAITFPAGYDEQGMPIGLHVLGRAWQEHRLLRIAHVSERLVERRSPRTYYRLLDGR